MSTETEPRQLVFPWLDTMKVSQLVERFVALRDARKRTEDEHETYVRDKYLNEMEAIETELLKHLEDTGANSIASDSGTAYRYDASSVTVSDQRLFKNHVIDSEAWDFIEWRAAKTAILEHIENDFATPPGVNVTFKAKIGVRRPTK